MFDGLYECEWVIKNKISLRFLKELWDLRKGYTGDNGVFSICRGLEFKFMKQIHETYEKYYELTPKEIHSKEQEVNEVPSIDLEEVRSKIRDENELISENQ